MITAIHQPQYIPWLGYMNKIANSDIFVFLDTVQFKKNEWQNRNRIKTATGCQWMTVPVCYHYPEKIKEVKINNRVNWGEKHWKTLVTSYNRAPYFHTYADFFYHTYNRDWEFLADLNIHIIKFLIDVWGLNAVTVKASQLEIQHTDPTMRLVAICRTLGADIYLSGRDGSKYMDLNLFYNHKINVCYQEFYSEVYPQLFKGFIPDMSSIDLLFNCGPAGKKIVEAQFNSSEGRRDNIYECTCYRSSSG